MLTRSLQHVVWDTAAFNRVAGSNRLARKVGIAPMKCHEREDLSAKVKR